MHILIEPAGCGRQHSGGIEHLYGHQDAEEEQYGGHIDAFYHLRKPVLLAAVMFHPGVVEYLCIYP